MAYCYVFYGGCLKQGWTYLYVTASSPEETVNSHKKYFSTDFKNKYFHLEKESVQTVIGKLSSKYPNITVDNPGHVFESTISITGAELKKILSADAHVYDPTPKTTSKSSKSDKPKSSKSSKSSKSDKSEKSEKSAKSDKKPKKEKSPKKETSPKKDKNKKENDSGSESDNENVISGDEQSGDESDERGKARRSGQRKRA